MKQDKSSTKKWICRNFVGDHLLKNYPLIGLLFIRTELMLTNSFKYLQAWLEDVGGPTCMPLEMSRFIFRHVLISRLPT